MSRVKAWGRRVIGASTALAVVAAISIVPAAAQDEPERPSGADVVDGKTIGIIVWNYAWDNEAYARWFERLALEDGAEQVIQIDPKGDPNNQIEPLDDMVAARVDGLVLHPINPAIVVTGAEAAMDAGIPLVYAGGRPDAAEVMAPMVEFDDYEVTREAGRNAARWLQTNRPGEPAKLVIFDILEVPYCTSNRMQGFVDGVTEIMGEDNVEIVFRDSVPHIRDQSFTRMEDLLQATPDFNIFTACGSDGVMGGVLALEAAGRGRAVDKNPETEYIFTIDAREAEVQRLLDPDSSVMQTMMMAPREIGYGLYDTMTNIMRGELEPDDDLSVHVGGALLTSDCHQTNADLEIQYGLVRGYQPIDCSQFGQ